MIEDVYEPLSAYRDGFKQEFAERTRDKFQELTERSGIDVEACRKQAELVHKLQKAIASARTKRAFIIFFLVLGYLAAIAGFIVAFAVEGVEQEVKVGGMTGGFLGLALGIWMTMRCIDINRIIDDLVKKEEEARRLAWQMMDPLNRLYTWDITVKLIEATVPRLEFDPFFTAKRLKDLKRVYDWNDDWNDGKSIIFAQTGVINGNPFVVGEYKDQDWGTKTYYGSLDIEWEEMERDSKGNMRLVTKYETLHASVDKPIPVYSKTKLLIYGNDAAPNLTFTRKPSGLDDNDLFDGIRAKWRLSRLKAYSRNLDDESQFTLMANHEFETWFHAKDRDNEVEFRLLFTALAQTQLMALMKDLKTGYGDDFSFMKDHKINYLYPNHLQNAPIDTDPERFHDWDYDRAAQNFQEFNEQYFKDIYFALAPLLAIPLYQQTRTHEDIWKDVIDPEGSNFWEHEAIANYYGEDRFKHPSCITENILKTAVTRRHEGVSDVEVTAHGYRGENRVDYVEVYGGDGNYHDVPVEWTEYLPVSRTSGMTLTESESPSAAFDSGYRGSASARFRRLIRSYLGARR